MYGEMFGTGLELANGAVIRALETADNRHAHSSHQVGIFPISLHPAAPPRVTEYVDVRGPESQTLIDAVRTFLVCNAVLYPCLIADGRKDFLKQGIVKRGSHAYRHREGGG